MYVLSIYTEINKYWQSLLQTGYCSFTKNTKFKSLYSSKAINGEREEME